MAFTKSTADLANISKLDDEPNDVGGLSAAELKAEFDAAAETLQSFVNTHVTELESSSATGNIGTIGLDGTTATNVQAVIVAIKALIDACETQAAATASLALKEDKTVTAQHYKAVTFDTNTGIFTFTRENGSTTSIDTALEKVATNWTYDAATQSLVLTLADGSTQSISLSAFITESEYLDSDTLDFSVSDHKITATVKDGSITDTKLSSALKTTLQNYVTQAVTSATKAAASEANALTYKNTAQSAQIAAVNAQTAAETAQEDAEVSAANAATSETNAGTSETNAADSAKDSEAYAIGKRGGVDVASGDPAYQNNSKYYKDQAAAIVGGDYATKTEAQGYVDTHNAAGDAHSSLFANKANKKVPAAANNVALLDSSGNLADSGKALTPAGIGAAATSHTHTASMITDLPTGKKAARFVVGTSTAGWTTADCDYLCDGTADQTEINAAITALPATGGEIVILDGTYNITAKIDVTKDNVSVRGNGNATILKRMFNSTSAEGVITLNSRSGCKIANLQIEGNKTSYTNNNNYGICLSASNSNVVTGNTCNNNSYGIYLSSSSNSNTVTGNTCNNNDDGISLSSSSNNTVTGNICNNNFAGIALDSSSNNNTVTDNICSNNRYYGICLSSSSNSNTVTGNTCNNNNYGICLSASNSNVVTGNTCNNNDYYGIHLNSSDRNTVTGNTCIRGTGLSTDYTESQHTIQLNGRGNSYNLIAMNNCMGKAVTNEGGTGNTLVNNKFDAT